MLRIIICQTDCAAAANVGGPVEIEYRTFDIEAPEVEAYLRAEVGSYARRQIVGTELRGAAPPQEQTR